MREASPAFGDGSRNERNYQRRRDASVKPTRATIETRLGERVVVDEKTGCWLFRGDPEEYGRLRRHEDGALNVHRFVYETLVGPIPKGFEIHHVCETVGCCNPRHLKPVTREEHKALHAH